MRRGLIGAAICAVALLCAGVARADADFTDAAGDANGAPDLTQISVANDALNRVILHAKIAGGKAMELDGEILFVIDADNNGATGSDGWDYLAVVSGGKQWALLSWDGVQWVDAPSSTVKVYFWNDNVLFTVDRSELGNTSRFGFFVVANKLAGEEVAATDVAPEGDEVWSYSTVTKTFGIAASPVFAVTKGGAVVGKPYVVGYLFGRTDSPEPAAGARTTCVATVAGKRVAARVTQEVEAASCRVVVPKTAKGKLLKLTLTTTSGGKKVTKSYSTKVR